MMLRADKMEDIASEIRSNLESLRRPSANWGGLSLGEMSAF